MNNSKLNAVVDKIESELLSALFNYITPFLSKKIKTPKKNDGRINLENIVENSKPKIDLNDIRALESLLVNNLTKSVKSNKRIEANASNFAYKLCFSRKKFESKPNEYSISIKYGENNSEERLSVTVKQAEKEIYSAVESTKKDVKDKVAPYSVSILYQDNYEEERLSVAYRLQIDRYMKKHIASKEDMSERVPLKWLNIHPESTMGGVLGFTYIGDLSMGRRADLTGKTARMVDIHESIHTPDEYETRVLTSWIMEKIKRSYVK